MSRSRCTISFEPLLEIFEDGAEVELVERLPALLAQLLQQVTQPLRALRAGVAHAALQHVAQGVLQVAEVHQVVGEALEDVVRVEFGDLLRAVPFAVPVAQHGLSDLTVDCGDPLRFRPRRALLAAILHAAGTLSLFSRLLRCSPSRMNSTAAAVSAGSSCGVDLGDRLVQALDLLRELNVIGGRHLVGHLKRQPGS